MTKIVIIGGGPGGYVAAIRAAQLGAKVTLVEKGSLGGTCLNVGCTPTKVLINTAEKLREFDDFEMIGIDISEKPKVNWEMLQSRKTDIVNHLKEGVLGLLKYNGIEIIEGTASFKDRNNIIVLKSDGSLEEVKSDYFIVATGSKVFIPPIPGSDIQGVIDSTGALSIEQLPKEMIIVGGGVIGSEFAYLFNSLGVKVTMIEMLPYILPPIDRQVANQVMEGLIADGVEVYTSSKVLSISENNEKLIVKFQRDDKTFELPGDKVLLAVGRIAVFDKLNCDKVGIEVEKKGITVDQTMKTNIPNIYAIGDVTGINMLAHVASEQGTVAVENIMGKKTKMLYNAVPACVYINPEVASVGMTEEEVFKKGIKYKKGTFNFANNGKSLILNEVDNTFIKIISDERYDEILGVHIYGPRATELIHEATLAIRLEATVNELVTTIHAHPTVAESIKEAAMAVSGNAIHAVRESNNSF